jgi:hypothetical protein
MSRKRKEALQDMEALVPHASRKAANEWQVRIRTWRSTLEAHGD